MHICMHACIKFKKKLQSFHHVFQRQPDMIGCKDAILYKHLFKDKYDKNKALFSNIVCLLLRQEFEFICKKSW